MKWRWGGRAGVNKMTGVRHESNWGVVLKVEPTVYLDRRT